MKELKPIRSVLLVSLTVFLALFTAIPASANKIGDLKTDEDVNNFISKYIMELKGFEVAPMKMLYYEISEQQFADSLGVKPWQKADFDNNGLSDLLVYGFWGGDPYLIAVIDEGKEFVFRSLNRGFGDEYFPVIKTFDDRDFLILNRGCKFYRDCKIKIISTDTLIYKFGDFIEPNFKPSVYKIKKIEYSTTMCFGTCPVFELEINSDRTAKYNAIQYNDEEGKFKTILDTARFNSIVSLLNYIDFPNLKDDYSVNWTDDQSCTLTITYDNGHKKSISDYGEIGTYGLQIIYKELFALRGNQKWK